MKRLGPPAALALLLAIVSNAALASQKWTFCAASDGDSKEVWITGVFKSTKNRRTVESEMQAALRRRTAMRTVVQCPEPSENKVEAVNAQTTAIEFNHRLGLRLHALPLRRLLGERLR